MNKASEHQQRKSDGEVSIPKFTLTQFADPDLLQQDIECFVLGITWRASFKCSQGELEFIIRKPIRLIT